MSIDLDELRIAIRGMLASRNPSQYPLYKVLREELRDYWRRRPGGKPFTKNDPRRKPLPNENKKPTA